MPLFDRVKTQAQQAASTLAEKAKEGAQAGQAKIDELQAKRQVDGLLRDLGQILYGQKTDRGSANDEAEIDRIVSEISALEADHPGAAGS